MQVPGNWESRGLPDFDGVVWFTRTIDVPARRAATRRLSLGAMRNTAEVWVNGLAGHAAGRRPRRRRRRAAAPPSYALPAGTLKPGAEPDHGAHPESRATTAASSARPSRCSSQVGEQQDGDRRAVEVPRRAADQRRHALLEAGRARRARRVHRRRRPRGRGGREPQAGGAAGAGRHAAHRRGARPAEVRSRRADGRAGPARRDRVREPRRDAAQLRARRHRVRSKRSAPPPTSSRSRRRAWRSSTCPTCRRCSSRPSSSSRAKPRGSSSRRPPRPRATIRTSARSRRTGA